MIKIYKPVAAAVTTTTTTITPPIPPEANANPVAVTTATAPCTTIAVSSDPQTKRKTAAEYVLELKLDDHGDSDDDDGDDGGMLVEVSEEMEKASTAWRKVMGGPTNPTAILNCSVSSSQSSSLVLCALVEALGTTYDEEHHGGALRRTARAHANTATATATDNATTDTDGSDVVCELTEELFVDWYVRMLYAEDQDEDPPVCTDGGPSNTSIQPPANSTLMATAAASGGIAGGVNVGDTWKCGVCLVLNKDKGLTKCACCDAPNPLHNPAAAGIVAVGGPATTSSVFSAGSTSGSIGGGTVMTPAGDGDGGGGGGVQSSITDKGFSFGAGNATTTGTSSIGATGFVFGAATATAAVSTPPQTTPFGLTATPASAGTVRTLFGLSSTVQPTPTATPVAPAFSFGGAVQPTAPAAAISTAGGGLFGQQPATNATVPGSSPLFVIRVSILSSLSSSLSSHIFIILHVLGIDLQRPLDLVVLEVLDSQLLLQLLHLLASLSLHCLEVQMEERRLLSPLRPSPPPPPPPPQLWGSGSVLPQLLQPSPLSGV